MKIHRCNVYGCKKYVKYYFYATNLVYFVIWTRVINHLKTISQQEPSVSTKADTLSNSHCEEV